MSSDPESQRCVGLRELSARSCSARRSGAAGTDARRDGPSRPGRCRAARRRARGLGHRRLSIVDLAGGHQPLSQRGRHDLDRLQRRDLQPRGRPRPELEAAGHRYRTRSDTETIVHAYEEWGDDCVERFRGMFAFAIWDAPRRRLLLARDRLGIKPLYWAQCRRRAAAVRAPRSRRSWRAACSSRGRTSAVCRSCWARAISRAKRRSSRVSTSCCPATRCLRGRPRHDRGSTGTSPQAGRDPDARRALPSRRLVAPVPRAARGVGPHAADGGRAARHVPVRRPRQQRRSPR